MPRGPETHYLKNKEILKEIHKSKMSYCWIADDKFFMHDHIVVNVDEVINAYNDKDRIAQVRIEEAILQESSVEPIDREPLSAYEMARANRASRLQKLAHEEDVERWQRGELKQKTKPKVADYAIDPLSIADTDLVFRVMTYSHIPLEDRKSNPKTEADHHARCNFPAFKHYALVNDEWTEVARSHWKGDLETGEWSITHGHTTERLALMYMKLCERYSMRSNWRGYTYVDEMRGQAILQLTQIGLQFNEFKSQNPFAYFTTVINNSFTRVLNLEKRNQNIRDDLLEEEGLDPSFTRSFNAEWEYEQDRHLRDTIPHIAENNPHTTEE